MLAARFKKYTVKRLANDGWGKTTSSTFEIQGFIQPIGGNESFAHLNLGQTINARMYCPVETLLNYGDTIGAYTVIYSFMPDGVSGTGHHKEVLLSQVIA